MEQTFDFIVVGGGTSGCVVASRLANSPAKPSVLLLEAGGENAEPESRIAGERHTFWITGGLALDHGYKTVSQPALAGRELAYHRGKGLGGSSATNLGLWDWGSRNEFEEWARIVGDDTWTWPNVVEHMKKIENYHNLTPGEYKHYVDPNLEEHGNSGPVDITLGGTWDPTLPLIMSAFQSWGEVPLVPDVSSTNSIGFGISPGTSHDGYRVTAASAYLGSRPDNLTVKTSSVVTSLVIENKKVKALKLMTGQTYSASKEIILCAGSIDTPKLLLLSGVGPAAELSELGIELVSDNPSIGRHLLDHPIIRLAAPIKDGFVGEDRLPAMAGAREQWLKERTGPLAIDPVLSAHGYCKLDTTAYKSLGALDATVQKHLTNASTPTYEMLSRITPGRGEPGFVWNVSVVMMNNQSTGRVFLQKDNPQGPPGIDLNFLSNEYDVDAVVSAVQKTADFLQHANIPIGPLSPGPASLGREDVLGFVRSNLGHLWHAAGTVKMGRAGDAGTCVTPDFRVQGLEGLRVADLSVMPIMTSCHTQSVAYLVGEVAAEKLRAEYSL